VPPKLPLTGCYQLFCRCCNFFHDCGVVSASFFTKCCMNSFCFLNPWTNIGFGNSDTRGFQFLLYQIHSLVGMKTRSRRCNFGSHIEGFFLLVIHFLHELVANKKRRR